MYGLESFIPILTRSMPKIGYQIDTGRAKNSNSMLQSSNLLFLEPMDPVIDPIGLPLVTMLQELIPDN